MTWAPHALFSLLLSHRGDASALGDRPSSCAKKKTSPPVQEASASALLCKHPFTPRYAGGGPMRSLFSVCKHPFTPRYGGGGPMRSLFSLCASTPLRRDTEEGAPCALSLLFVQAPLYAKIRRRGPHVLSLFSICKHPFTLRYAGGGPMIGCILLARIERSATSTKSGYDAPKIL
jgi:hypothetical protein